MQNPGRFNVTLGSILSLALLLAQAPAALAQNKHTLPLFVSASHQTLQGFARIINLSERDGVVAFPCTVRERNDHGHGPCHFPNRSPNDRSPAPPFLTGDLASRSTLTNRCPARRRTKPEDQT